MQKLFFLIGRLHRQKFSGLRVMPIQQDGIWQFLVGPRMFFSKRDGAYVPEDLRHRCITVGEWHAELFTPPASDWKILEKLFALNNGKYAAIRQHLLSPCFDPEVLSPEEQELLADLKADLSSWLEHSRVSDPDYTNWFITLCGHLAIDDQTTIGRDTPEASKPQLCPLYRTRQSHAWEDIYKQYLPPPPPGRAESSGPWRPKSEDIAIAQMRDTDAPSLIWPRGDNQYSHTALDNWYEENT